MSKWAKLTGILVSLFFVTLTSPAYSGPTCTLYQNSHAEYYFPYGAVCIGTGSGCQECINQDEGGATVCIQDFRIKICIDYQF